MNKLAELIMQTENETEEKDFEIQSLILSRAYLENYGLLEVLIDRPYHWDTIPLAELCAIIVDQYGNVYKAKFID